MATFRTSSVLHQALIRYNFDMVGFSEPPATRKIKECLDQFDQRSLLIKKITEWNGNFSYQLGPSSGYNWILGRDYKNSKVHKVKTKRRLLTGQLVPNLLLLLPLPRPPLPLSPPCRRLPLAVPCSSWSPDIGMILTRGAWCHSVLLFIMHSALDMIILTASFTCLTSGVL